MAEPMRPADIRLENADRSWPIGSDQLVYEGVDDEGCHRWVAHVPDPDLHMMMMTGQIQLSVGMMPPRTGIVVDFSPSSS